MHGIHKPSFNWKDYKPPVDRTLFDHVVDTLEAEFGQHRIFPNRDSCTINIKSVSNPTVVHQLTLKRV